MSIEPTRYYENYLKYHKLAEWQQAACNLGMIPHEEWAGDDELMKEVQLYDVVERKYAGFSQMMNDVFYADTSEHPYDTKIRLGVASPQRKEITKNWSGKHSDFDLPEWLYIFMLHRLCGSAINYAQKPSGYFNSIVPYFYKCKTIEDMTEMVNSGKYDPFYTSVGYQFPQFPKPPAGSEYKRGGDYYLTEFVPTMVRELAEWLEGTVGKREIREIGDWLFDWNVRHGCKKFKFQFAAFISDICDWYPQYVVRESMFYYGSNAVECISYMAKPTTRMNREKFLDEVMDMVYTDTGAVPYNAEDIMCDSIRWIENYIKPGDMYDHLDFNEVWSTSDIVDHPCGRQKMMLNLGLVDDFNKFKSFPSDTRVLDDAGVTKDQYNTMVREYMMEAIT